MDLGKYGSVVLPAKLRKRGVSPIIATLLLVAIAVVGGAIIFSFTQGYFASTQLSGTDVGVNPKKPTGLGMVPGSYTPSTTTESQPAPSVDDENNTAWGHIQTSEFKPRDTSLDQLPQQFAQGPVMPPTSGYPQLPQSTGGLAKILAAFA